MATVVVTPVLAKIATVQGLTGIAGSSFLTATVQVTSGWELRLPFQAIQAANVSAGPELRAFAAVADAIGTPPYATIPLTFGLNRSGSGNDTYVCTLPTGIWCLALCSGGPNTATVGIGTAELITAVNQV